MPPNILFAFGPNSSFFFYCDGQIIHDNCSWAFQETVLSRIKRPYHIFLGPGENDYAAFYETKDGKRRMSINYPSDPKLKGAERFFSAQLKARPEDVSTANMVATLQGNYVASTAMHTTGIEFASSQMRDALMQRASSKAMDASGPNDKNMIMTLVEPPRPAQMSAGVYGTWFIRWGDGVCAWDLADEKKTSVNSSDGKATYSRLRSLLEYTSSKEVPPDIQHNIDYLVLDPWNSQHWFCVIENGNRVEYSLSEKAAMAIGPLIERYIQGRFTVSTVFLADGEDSVDDQDPPPKYEG